VDEFPLQHAKMLKERVVAKAGVFERFCVCFGQCPEQIVM
jgi:hypothetical protein